MLKQNKLQWPRLNSNNYHMLLDSRKTSLGARLNMSFYEQFSLVYDTFQ